MFARFLTIEPLLLLLLSLALITGVAMALGLGVIWIAAGCLVFVLFGWMPLAVRLQDWLLETYLSRGWFKRALAVASAIRDAAPTPLGRSLAEFDLGLVHLARGAPADATRSFGRMDKHRLKPMTRALVELYAALARLRSLPDGIDRTEPANLVLTAAREAEATLGEDPHLLAARGEAHLHLGDMETARELLTRSLNLEPDPQDPSPGERYVLFARAADGAGARDAARRALEVAARLKADGPFVREAREKLAGGRGG